jgi:uncharacterized repeat protein (TIGR02543 family)
VGGTVSATGAGTCLVDVNVAGDANYSASSTTVTVTFTPVATSSGGATRLVQTTFVTGTVSSHSSGTFTAGPITVEGNLGPVTFVTTSPSSGLTVSSTGAISTTGALSVGTYSALGTDSDAEDDSGTWGYTLSVTAAAATVTATVSFEANAGTGAMLPEIESAPTELFANSFVRTGYTFVGWNTKANGSGISYANEAVFPFDASTTLFAQWKHGKSPKRTITFARNGGTGATASEIENAPTAIAANHFKRQGYTFVDWNTNAKGSGTRYAPGTTYPFKKSITLYAQWKKTPKTTKSPTKPPHPKAAIHVVTFAANGGAGVMTAESHRSPTALTPNHFTRSGYTFVDWNTRPNGSGNSYASAATYPFGASTTLYAQWKKLKVIPPTPAIPDGVIIGPFGLGSTSLTPGLESEIQSLANEAKTEGKKQLTLYGFGDSASSSSTNASLGRGRAVSVATYLEARLAAIGLKGWTISFEHASASPSEISSVVATLS